ncbi:uncharacterized protein LOC116182246 [Photinus pyralis]|nr:uncharacterized protein LOC116163398 [Photinus pyralis]XP_031358624.1 uncharacterized protein LOC116182246 [Photinus pyralis]
MVRGMIDEILDQVEEQKQSTKDCKHLLKEIVRNVELNTVDEDDLNTFAWGSSDEYESINNSKLDVEVEEHVPKLHGYRIVDIEYILRQTVTLQSEHSKKCTGGMLVLQEEIQKGLVSRFVYRCNICEKTKIVYSENPEKEIINRATVWGTLATGSTFAHTSEFLSILDIPPMRGNMFFDIQRNLGDVWKDSLWQNMEKAGQEERKIAVEHGDVDTDGTPFITVFLDGGWSKRSYGHSYNAASGVAVIIGRATGKLLYLGVRNKFCSICARAQNKNNEPKKHLCFRNWTGSSSSMEADIIVEGFNSSINMHNLRYKKFIADGDSTVYSHIRKRVSYGEQVVKIECTNHAIKNYSKHLYKLKSDTKNVALATRKLLSKDTIGALVKFAQKAIYANSHGDIATLKSDLRNSVKHVFGNHLECVEYLCSETKEEIGDKYQTLISIGGQHQIYAALNSILSKSELLIDRETNNRAELFMSVLARFNMGKRLNLIQRDSFQTRSFLTGLRYNEGSTWHTEPWKQCFKDSPGKNFQKYMEKEEKKATKRKSLASTSTVRKRTKFTHEGSSSGPPRDYGPDFASIEPRKDALDEEVRRLVQRLEVTEEERTEISVKTIGQFDNCIYKNERLHRLTASKFGDVVKRKDTTSCDALVKSILSTDYSFQSPAMEYGKIHEGVAISKFETLTGKKVQQAGLYIDVNCGYLGASPDGIICENEIVEVKCSFKVANMKKSLKEAVESKEVQYLTLNENGDICLKKTHNYYYQIQGQLAITNAKTCFFIVYSGDDNELFVQEVLKDSHLWNATMLPKLMRFYLECVAPEIILNRRGRNLKCVDPQYILDAQKEQKQKQTQKQKRKQKQTQKQK